MLTQVHAAPGEGLDAFFKARGVAVVGASDDITKIGGRPVQLLRKYGYAGAIYPINPKGGTIQGLQGAGKDLRVTVAFDDEAAGTRQLLVAYAGLEREEWGGA